MKKGIWYLLLIPLIILTTRQLLKNLTARAYDPEIDGSSLNVRKSDKVYERRGIMEIHSQEPKSEASPIKENVSIHPKPVLFNIKQNDINITKETSRGRVNLDDTVSRSANHSKVFKRDSNSTILGLKEEATFTTIPNNSSVNTNPYYFPWEDDKHVNYTDVCSRILSTLSKFKGPIIVNSGYRGGLGHISVSFYYSLTYALLLKRPLYLHLKPSFWKHTNNCFQSLQYRGNISALRYCNLTSTCFESREEVSSLTKEPVLIQDLRISRVPLFSDRHLRIISKFFLGIAEINEWKDYKRLIFRLFTNPSQELISIILENRKKLGPYHDLIGAHVRCGGNLADSKEGVYWIDRNGLSRVPFTFRKAIRKLKLKPKKLTVYLATDSSAAEEFLRETLILKIVSFDSYKRGHTTSATDDSVYQRAIIDMYLVSQASVIIYTHVSGFSEAVLSIAKTGTSFVLPFSKTIPV